MSCLHFCFILALIHVSFCFNISETDNKEIVRSNSSSLIDSEDADLNITRLVTKYGYNIEQHKVITEDGYVLTVYRIPPRINLKRNIPIFLMHGLLDSSDAWILQGPKYALAYILADKGFDVWMGNARGNKYSTEHTSLKRSGSEYWKFSWDEISYYDLPAMIDYTLKETGFRKLYYVGHSQGTTTSYVMMSLRPEYNNRVDLMFSLSPVAWMSNAKSFMLKLFAPTYGLLNYLPSNTYVDHYNTILGLICKYFLTACDNYIQQVIGHDFKYTEPHFLRVIFAHTSSAGLRQFFHYGQLYSSGRFCRYDYGLIENLLKYKSVTPPEYDLTKVTVPIQLFYSDNDWLSNVTDVKILYSKLPNVAATYRLNKFNHLDYLYAKVARDLVYNKIIQEIEEKETIGK
ncbi:unnamed protein product [Danaus chrysippus]|uniref:Lipase n=1 Tax=Danaus chrysippus TaxID=151541 RepID=A0A8J2QGU1_9NEOP|nr:unnamed protein product [Danaus chrysippus]